MTKHKSGFINFKDQKSEPVYREEIHFFFQNIPNKPIISISFFFFFPPTAESSDISGDMKWPYISGPADHVTTGHQHPNPLWIKLQHHVQLQRSNHLSMFIPGGSTNANKDEQFQSVNVGACKTAGWNNTKMVSRIILLLNTGSQIAVLTVKPNYSGGK